MEKKVKFTISKKLLTLCSLQELWPPAAPFHYHAK